MAYALEVDLEGDVRKYPENEGYEKPLKPFPNIVPSTSESK